jgi:hypothetical protein
VRKNINTGKYIDKIQNMRGGGVGVLGSVQCNDYEATTCLNRNKAAVVLAQKYRAQTKDVAAK